MLFLLLSDSVKKPIPSLLTITTTTIIALRSPELTPSLTVGLPSTCPNTPFQEMASPTNATTKPCVRVSSALPRRSSRLFETRFVCLFLTNPFFTLTEPIFVSSVFTCSRFFVLLHSIRMETPIPLSFLLFVEAGDRMQGVGLRQEV